MHPIDPAGAPLRRHTSGKVVGIPDVTQLTERVEPPLQVDYNDVIPSHLILIPSEPSCSAKPGPATIAPCGHNPPAPEPGLPYELPQPKNSSGDTPLVDPEPGGQRLRGNASRGH